jgi:glycosyltransferase involved in cell wall biosynthesis
VFPHHPALRLLHLVDYDILYSGHGLMRTADLIITTADSINDKVRTIAPGVPLHRVGHALDARWLKGADELITPRSGSPRLAVYSGQFYNTYIDWDALETVAVQHPAIHFRYIGNVDPDYPSDAFQRLRRLPNVEFTGLVTKDDLIPRVREADILFFCFMTDRNLLERANPHKVLEYLSTGNVIVGSRTLEYDGRNDLMLQGHERQDFVPRFAEAVRDHARLNTTEARAHRIAYAKERTVGHLLGHVERLLRDVQPPHRHRP